MQNICPNVSPNRKALYQQAKNAVKSSNHNPKCQGIGELSLLDFLERAEGNKSDLAERSLFWQEVVHWSAQF